MNNVLTGRQEAAAASLETNKKNEAEAEDMGQFFFLNSQLSLLHISTGSPSLMLYLLQTNAVYSTINPLCLEWKELKFILLLLFFLICWSPLYYVLVANSSPKISVVSVLNVTVGQTSEFTVTTSDVDGDAVSLSLATPLPSGATFNNITGRFQWTPRNNDAVNIT